MEPLSRQLDFSTARPELPDGFSNEIFDLSRSVTSPDMAGQVFEKLQPLLRDYRADKKLALACGMLVARLQPEKDTARLWSDLQALFPDDATALRMLMRWYRRDGKIDAGIAHVRSIYPECSDSVAQARNAVIGLTELRAWDEIDTIMGRLLKIHPRDRSLKMAYIKALNEQMRFPEAAVLARHVADRERMGAASQTLLASVERKARTLEKYGRVRTPELIADMIRLAGAPRRFQSAERVVLFTGQLGTGGAERQLTRIACSYLEQARQQGSGPVPQVWVRHANPDAGADFYLPTLQKAGVVTRVLFNEPEVPIARLEGVPGELRALLDLLPPDVSRHVGQLTTMFLEHRTDVAYLWQDGGILQSAIAAVVAGVPRIVTSFRGLPPNMRPHLFREELPVLYGALARLPHVTFTANSQKTATAYERWLSLPAGTVVVIPNATPPVLPDGDDTDHRLWSTILETSSTCTKTVLGVFRFDANKRPLDWIEAAARYLANHDDTRFVLLGSGHLAADCADLIEERGLAHRIFLAGVRANVGFYMHRADLVMHLAQMEGLPNVLIEAQRAGTPVLATPAGGTDEVVKDGVTGFLLSDAETLPLDELDYELDALLARPDVLAQLGAAAIRNSSERFSTETILRRTTELFNTYGRDAA